MSPVRRGKIRLANLTPLATGGMGELRKGVQPDGTPLVLRELHTRHVFKPRVHLCFVRGTKIREMLSPHPNLIFSVDRGHQGLRPYEVIEYVDGANLRQLLDRKKEFVSRHLHAILVQSARALAHMHQNRILHLDVKAENFMVVAEGDTVRVKLTDFDLARDCESACNRHRAGTPKYMAPEELRHGTVDIGTDIFAFGVFAYYLVTGHMPFEGNTVAESRRNQLSDKYRVIRPSEWVKDLTPKLEQTIMQCIEKKSQKRLPSMAYISQMLEDLKTHE
ncbi:MAG: serine/threonine protein kinase [Verrucomicrobiota bacterium]